MSEFDSAVSLPYLNEHEGAPEKTDDARPYSPSEDEQKLIKHVYDTFKKYKQHRDRYDQKWLSFYKMFRGKQWPDHRPSWRHSDVVNMIFQTIQGTMPLETDARPKITYLPTEPSDTPLAEIMNEVSEADWENQNWLLTLIEVVLDKYLYGTGMSSVEFDPEAAYGAGQITYKSKDPFYCFPDPEARDVNVEARGFIYAEPMDVEKVRKMYPDKRAYIQADAQDVFGDRTDLAPLKLRSNIDQRVVYEERNPQEYSRKDEVLVVTLYEKSDDYEEEEQTKTLDDGTTETSYVQKLKYPNGRKVVVCNNVLLYEGPCEYEDGEVPFQRCVNYILPREFWGISEIEQLEGPQKLFNKFVCIILDILTMTGNPILMVDSTAGLDTDNLFNRPGDVWEKDPNSQINWLSPGQINPVFLQMVDRLKQWFDELAGAQDVTRGVAPASVTAAAAIEALQEAAQTRTRQKLRLIDCYLKDVGRQYASRVFQFYTVPRIFRLTGRDDSQKYFKFHAETIDSEAGPVKKVTVTPYVENAGQWSEGVPSEYILRGQLDVRASTGSGLPFAKAQKEQRLIKLFELGAIDQEELLKGMDYPNAQIIIQRMQERAAQAAQAQAQAQGAAPPHPQH